MDTKITVVIPNYNGIKFIKECLETVLCQEDAPAYEVVVVDNGSTDGSRELVEQEFPQVKLLAQETNTGFCHAVNVGIEYSKAPYVLLLNNDTKVDVGFVKALYDAIDSKPNCFSVSAKMLAWDDESILDDAGDRYCVLGWAYGRGKGKPADDYSIPVKIFSACGGAAIYRREVFEKIGLFDEAHFAYLEDLDIGYRALLCGYENWYAPEAKVVHYGSAASGSRYNTWKTDLAAQNSVYVIAKNMPLLQMIWNLPFLLLGFIIKFLFFCRKKMGTAYLKGLWKGLQKSLSKEGKSKHLGFGPRRVSGYFYVQIQLYLNLFRFLKKF